jgi:hypothetical protein
MRIKGPEYNSWRCMKQHCLNPRNIGWKDYGGRGITVCDRWLLYGFFFMDMGPKPSPKHTLERIDNDGNYEPGNCRWATPVEQQANTKARNAARRVSERLKLKPLSLRSPSNVASLPSWRARAVYLRLISCGLACAGCCNTLTGCLDPASKTSAGERPEMSTPSQEQARKWTVFHMANGSIEARAGELGGL